MMLHTFLAALAARLVVGPTLPDSWACAHGSTRDNPAARRTGERDFMAAGEGSVTGFIDD
jgi:hypothetical protein